MTCNLLPSTSRVQVLSIWVKVHGVAETTVASKKQSTKQPTKFHMKNTKMIIWWSYMIMCVYIYMCNICNICNYLIVYSYIYIWLHVIMYIWLYMYVWLYMIIYDYIWLYMIIYDYIWLYMYEYIWLFTVQLHINCLTKKTYIYIFISFQKGPFSASVLSCRSINRWGRKSPWNWRLYW